MIVYTINGFVTRKKLDEISHRGYFMVYADTTEVIIYWKPKPDFLIHISHHVWYDEYESRHYI